jgi:hypothetical protein
LRVVESRRLAAAAAAGAFVVSDVVRDLAFGVNVAS